MKKIFIIQSTIVSAGVFAKEGDEIEVSNDIADTLIEVGNAVLQDNTDNENKSDVLLLSIAKADAVINKIDDVEKLHSLLIEEKNNNNRKGIIALISERIAELSADDEQDNSADDEQDNSGGGI